MHTIPSIILLASSAAAYPWVAGQPGVDSSLFKSARPVEKRQASCPFNADHKGAAPYTATYPYVGAKNGIPGTGKGGIKVPADGDTAHAFTAPGSNDIRGPCPGLNAAANHNFLSHDGITTFNELVDAQQNVYNVGYDLAVLLAVLGIQAGGDIVTGKLSIGCDATSRTALLPLLGKQPGLNGHNKFEADSSLTRNDYYTANGDNYDFNGTLFASMKKSADSLSGGKFDRNSIAAFRSQRYDESVQQNANVRLTYTLLMRPRLIFIVLLRSLVPAPLRSRILPLRAVPQLRTRRYSRPGNYEIFLWCRRRLLCSRRLAPRPRANS